MQTMLRTLLTAAVVTAATALASHPAMAATATANVPFSFMASGKLCPAGTYTVRTGQLNEVLNLTNTPNRVNMVWVAGPGTPNSNDTRVVLRFDRVGSSYVLRNIQYGNTTTSRLDHKIPAQEPPTEILGQ